jgi:hypothetical protein
MQNTLSPFNSIQPQPHWPLVDDASPQAIKTIKAMSQEDQVQAAAYRILSGKKIYFTFSDFHRESPFRIDIRYLVASKVKEYGYEVDQEEHRYDRYYLPCPSKFTPFLVGVWMKLKKINSV